MAVIRLLSLVMAEKLRPKSGRMHRGDQGPLQRIVLLLSPAELLLLLLRVREMVLWAINGSLQFLWQIWGVLLLLRRIVLLFLNGMREDYLCVARGVGLVRLLERMVGNWRGW